MSSFMMLRLTFTISNLNKMLKLLTFKRNAYLSKSLTQSI